jgi:acetyl-CoA carboxylase biotin carboxyl carrier protein
MKINKETIKELSEYLNEFNLTEIEYTDKDTKIKVSKTSATVTAAATPIQATSATKNSKNDISKQQPTSGTKVTSPIIGTAYHAPEPGAKKFVEIGKKIKKGDTVMIVEAMKTMNHVPSTADGIVKEICVEDGQPVEFGQTIIIVE